MKTLSLIVGILFIIAPHSFAQNVAGPDQSKKELADDLSSLYRAIYTEYHKQVSNLLAQSVYVINPSGAMYYAADKNSKVVKKTTFGETFQVLKTTNSWYKVEGSDPTSGKELTGWVSRDQVRPAHFPNMPFKSEASFTNLLFSISPKKFDEIVNDLYQKAVAKATELQEKWEKNPYIKITGFDVEVSFPPGVTFNFEFK